MTFFSFQTWFTKSQSFVTKFKEGFGEILAAKSRCVKLNDNSPKSLNLISLFGKYA